MAYIVCIPKSVYKVQLLALQLSVGRMPNCVLFVDRSSAKEEFIGTSKYKG